MIVYIAGKITGDPEYRCKFEKAKSHLLLLGFTVLNPASLPDGLEYEQYMSIGFAMLDEADIVYLLPDYLDSPGALREINRAKFKEKIIIGSNYNLNVSGNSASMLNSKAIEDQTVKLIVEHIAQDNRRLPNSRD